MNFKALVQKKNFRKALGKKSLFYFGLIYFPQMFTYESAPFHKRWAKKMSFKRKVIDEDGSSSWVKFTYFILMAFRGSAKTSWAKIKVVRDICYGRRKYIGYVCYEMDASKAALLDIANWLQTNKRIIRDFGNLYFDPEMEKNRSKEKGKGNFVTTNGIRVKALSIRKSVRGAVKDFDRPDAYVCDDFENNITKKSAALTRKAIDFFKELFSGMADDAEVIFVCNRISDIGSVQFLIDTAEENPEWDMEDVPVYDEKGITWPERFVMTDKEAEEVNKGRDIPKKSIESIRNNLNNDGTMTFEQEYLNQPLVEGDRFFKVEPIDKRIAILKAREWQSADPKKEFYREIDENWIIWGEFDPKKRYAIAGDVAEGYGLDSSTIEVWDLDGGDQLMEFESNQVPPDLLAEYMFQKYKDAKGAGSRVIVTPERNAIGIATVNHLKSLNCHDIFREKAIDKITERPVAKYGWSTNSKTKPTMLFEFKRDWENGLIGINSIKLLREMRAFSNKDVTNTLFDPEISQHYDRLMAACIAWQMRKQQMIKGVRA